MYRAIIITVLSDLLTEPFRPVGGHAEVPEKPASESKSIQKWLPSIA